MSDRLIRGTAADGQIRFFAADSRDLVEFARTAHGLSPIATAALGRLLTAGSMMGAMMKKSGFRMNGMSHKRSVKDDPAKARIRVLAIVPIASRPIFIPERKSSMAVILSLTS